MIASLRIHLDKTQLIAPLHEVFVYDMRDACEQIGADCQVQRAVQIPRVNEQVTQIVDGRDYLIDVSCHDLACWRENHAAAFTLKQRNTEFGFERFHGVRDVLAAREAFGCSARVARVPCSRLHMPQLLDFHRPFPSC